MTGQQTPGENAGDRPAPAEVRAALDRVLESERFTSSPTLCAFLRYVTEETLAGRAERLKAYSIATSALDRPDDFNPNDNALVRVQARRVRDALAGYYDSEGRDDPIRIDMPVGTYVPVFTSANAPVASRATEDVEADAAERPAGARRVPRFGLTAALLLAVLALVLAGIAYGGWYYWANYTLEAHRSRLAMINGDTTTNTGLDAGQVLPLLAVAVEGNPTLPLWFDPAVYQQRIEVFAQRFDDFVIVRHNLPPDSLDPLQPAYRMAFTFTLKDGAIKGLAQLSSLTDGNLIVAEPFTLTEDMARIYEPGSHFKTPEDLKIVRDAVQVYGVIPADVTKRGTINDPLACLMKARAFTVNPEPANHLAARTCLEKTIRENPRLVPAYVLLAEVYLVEHRRKLNPLPGDPLERAEAAARQAIRISPSSSSPYLALQDLLLMRGDVDAALRAERHAVELNPENMETLAAYGSVLARIGHHLEAANELLRAAANLRPTPPWVNFYAFLALNNLGRAGSADRQTQAMGETRDPLYLSAIAITAHRAGDQDKADAAIEAMIAADPTYRTDPLAAMRKRGLSDSVADMLLYDLRKAGLKVDG